MRPLLGLTAVLAVFLAQSCTKNKFSADPDQNPEKKEQAAQQAEPTAQPAQPETPPVIATGGGTSQPAVNANQSTGDNVLRNLAEELLNLPGSGPNNIIGDGGETPLVLDWDQDDSLTMLKFSDFRRILFDIDGDGTLDFLEWVAPAEAFLALDRNQNGIIDSGRELFGSATPGRYDESRRFGNGFAALSEFDDNHDGKIDSRDEVFARLSIWRDLNANGRTDEGELTDVSRSPLRSISLSYQNLSGHGRSIAGMQSTVGQLGTSELHSGKTMKIYDVHFAVMARNLFALADSAQRGEK